MDVILFYFGHQQSEFPDLELLVELIELVCMLNFISVVRSQPSCSFNRNTQIGITWKTKTTIGFMLYLNSA